MSSSRAPAARACLAITAALSIAVACSAASAEPAGAAPHAAKSQRSTRQAKCDKAGRHREANRPRELAKRTARGRTCGPKRSSSAAQPAEPASTAPAPSSTPKPKGSTASYSPPPPATPQAPPGSEPPSDPGAALGETPFRFFSPSSFWNTPLAGDAATDPNSAAITDAFETTIARELQAGEGPWINTSDYSVPIYTVPEGQPTVPVRLVNQSYSPSLQSAWREVPLPPDAVPSAGSDQHLVVWQPSSDQIWEFWRLARVDGEWRAAWGGAMRNVSSSTGVYGPEAWSGAESWWGSSASSLSVAGGLITLEDLQRGEIDHGLAMAVPNVRSNVYTAPARRTDGTSGSPHALPEGAHLRLDPDLDLAALHLPPLTLMIAEAAQRYGIVIRDRSKVAHFFAQDPRSLGTNPYLGRRGYFEGKSPAQLLSRFPWGQLQLLPMELQHWG